MGALRTLIEPAAWHTALEKFGAATGLTIVVYESHPGRVSGPVHVTPLFQAIHRDGRRARAVPRVRPRVFRDSGLGRHPGGPRRGPHRQPPPARR